MIDGWLYIGRYRYPVIDYDQFPLLKKPQLLLFRSGKARS